MSILSITPEASQRFKDQLGKRGGLGIYVGTKTTGCSGLAYVLEFVDSPKPDLEEILVDDIRIFIDFRAKLHLAGSTIHWVKRGLNEGFEFQNPNERGRCGCGESFRV